MNTAIVNITDPAKELAGLAELFRHGANSNNTVEGISKCIGIDVNHYEFLEVMAAMQRRVVDVERLATEANDPDFDQDLRNAVLISTKGFQRLLHPNSGRQNWDSLRTQTLPDKNITALKFFSQTARRYRTLRVISDIERGEAIKRLDDAIVAAKNDDDIEDWKKGVLIFGLERLRTVLVHLKFFGHDAVISELFFQHQKIRLIEKQEGEAPPRKNLSLWGTLVALSVIGNLFILPDQTLTAMDRYKKNYSDWIVPALQDISSPVVPPDQRLLPAPVAIKEDAVVPEEPKAN